MAPPPIDNYVLLEIPQGGRWEGLTILSIATSPKSTSLRESHLRCHISYICQASLLSTYIRRLTDDDDVFN